MFNVDIFNQALERGDLYRVKCYLRLMHAYFPECSVDVAAEKIYSLLDSSGVGAIRVLCSFRQEIVSKETLLSDLRFVLRGKHVIDTSLDYKYPYTIEQIKALGLMIKSNAKSAEIYRALRINKNTVRAIDCFLNLRKTVDDELFHMAGEALKDGVSTRQFAKNTNLSKSSAARLMKEVKLLRENRTSAQCNS